MATRTLQPSEYDIQREVEALRDIRRRSITPGALTIDPDLPNQSSPPSTSYRLGASSTSLPLNQGSTPASPSDSSSTEGSSTTSDTTNTIDSASTPDDPFHLFWVPASVHPEIAPAEFRAFLKEHARSPAASDDGSNALERSSSFSSSSSSSLFRKRSMLSRQYRPTEHDGIEDEQVLPLKRNRSGFYANRGPQLTISDLQKLEELAEQASQSDDPSRLRSVLRRSLSLNLPPSAIDKMDEIPEIGDEADAPIIVPPPGLILRRAARTKIRKPSLPGDGGGHRFGSPRRGVAKRAQTAVPESRTSSDRSSSDHGESFESFSVNHRRQTLSDEGSQRPESYSEEAQIFDAYTYIRDDDDDSSSALLISSPPPPVIELPEVSQPPQLDPLPELPSAEISPSLFEALGPILTQPLPQSLTSPQSSDEQQDPSRTPSPPPEPPSLAVDHPTPPQIPPSFPSITLSPPTQQPRKDKDKKSLFGKWGSDKGSKKGAKEKDRENRDRTADKEKDKDSGFFGSLFGGGSKKKQDDSPPQLVPNGTSGREAAQALLGAPKSKAFASPLSPGFSAGIGPNAYARYPIHVERAIYRLSHIKLANPRRPLYEQVLISNLMFWYLGVINKAQSSHTLNGQAVGTQAPGAIAVQGDPEKERREKELRENERLESERLEQEQREMENKKRESSRRGSLTKTSPGSGRRAEIPIKGPQYEMQHRAMEQQMGRSMSPPAGSGSSQHSRSLQQPQSPQPNNSQIQSQAEDYIYYSTDQNQQRLPPGAMPSEHFLWQQSQMRPQSSAPPPSSPPQQTRLPPQKDNQSPSHAGRYKNVNTSQDNLVLGGGNERLPGRSLSVNAVPTPPPQTNGRVRKGQSAHAAMSSPARRPRSIEGRQDLNATAEEDMPLAMWQQQRRR